MPRSCDEVPVGSTSAFSNGRNQTISNTNILNAHGNITYMEWDPQLTSEAFNTFLQTLSYFKEAGGSKLATPGLSSRSESNLNSPVQVDSNVTDDGDDFPEKSNKERAIALIASHVRAFLPNTTRAPTSRQIYVKTLFPLNYGFPLWFPEMGSNLPLEHRRNGISIGDVGVISWNGSFDRLFNIWLPANHPLNPKVLPSDFETFPRPPRSTASQISFDPGHSTISNLDVTSQLDDNSGDITIACKDVNQGALIVIPDGASEEDIKNERDLMQFISRNAYSWYQYALRGGHVMDRHSLYFVTGSMKTKTWGISTFEKTVPERTSTLVIGKPNHTEARTSYVWKKTEGAATFRVGPRLDFAGVVAGEDSLVGFSENQCLFIRGFKISLSNKLWETLSQPRPYSPVIPSNTLSRYSFPDHQQFSVGNSPSVYDRTLFGRPYYDRVKFPNLKLPRSSGIDDMVHPSDALNDMLLSQLPGAEIAITHDKIWKDLINCNTGQINSNKEIKERYVITYYQGTGMCSLERRDEVQAQEVGSTEMPKWLKKRSRLSMDDKKHDNDETELDGLEHGHDSDKHKKRKID